MTRPLRILIVGDWRYQSEFLFGVHQGAALIGHWPICMDIRSDLGAIATKMAQVQPDVCAFHMLMWSPMGGQHTLGLLDLCATWRKRGTKILIHDGDARISPRWPHDISEAVDAALCNHTADRSVWKIPAIHWPYFAFHQADLAEPVAEFRCDLLFAGRQGGGLYAHRTALLTALAARLGPAMKVYPSSDVPHTLFRTPEVAASATAILGHGRAADEAPGWQDVRYYQYPGAGGVLLHDDLSGPLEPLAHFVPYLTGNVDSIVCGIEHARRHPEIRAQAFAYVQAHHSSVVRVRQALAAVGL